jgi:hypothetical protein
MVQSRILNLITQSLERDLISEESAKMCLDVAGPSGTYLEDVVSKMDEE